MKTRGPDGRPCLQWEPARQRNFKMDINTCPNINDAAHQKEIKGKYKADDKGKAAEEA